MKRTNKKDISYNKLIQIQQNIRDLEDRGITLFNPKSKMLLLSGSCLLLIGLVTLPLPTGSFILISVGLSLLSSGGINIYIYRKELTNKIKYILWRLKG